MSFLSGLPAVVASKAAIGITVATLAVGGAAAVTATAATGSANPAVWGKTVTAAVADCKGKLKDGMHAIGSCVSEVAKQKGEEEGAPSTLAARLPTAIPLVPRQATRPGLPRVTRPAVRKSI